MRRLVTTLLATFFLTASATEAASLSIGNLKNLRLGMSLAEVRALRGENGGFTQRDFPSCFSDKRIGSCTSRAVTVAQIPANVTLRFVAMTEQRLVHDEMLPEAGTTAHEARTLDQEARQRLEKEREQLRSAARARNAQRRAKVEAAFKLAIIEVGIEAEKHGALVAAYKSKAGAPTSTAKETYRNSFNAEFSGLIDRWVDGDVSAMIAERCGRVDRSCLFIESAALKPELQRAIDHADTERAKDL